MRQRRKRDPLERFWEKVNLDGPIMPGMESPCWIWTASRFWTGYGRFNEGNIVSAHVFAWTIENGAVPAGLDIDHRCRNRVCVRVSHLRLGTRSQNIQNLSSSAFPTNGTSRHRGVSWCKKKQKWRAYAMLDQRQYSAGEFDTEEEAAEGARRLRNWLFTHNDEDRVNNSDARAPGRHLPAEARFWARVDQTGECWLWTGSINHTHGYGKISHNGRQVSVHRFAYELLVGPIPAGHGVFRTCRQALCVKPDHLYTAVSSQEEQAVRGVSRFRGVTWDKNKQRWRARVKYQGKYREAGYYTDEEEAGEAARKLREKLLPAKQG